MTKVFQGKMTYVEAAKELGLPQSTVWHCFTTHWEVVSTEEGVALRLKQAHEMDDFVSILKEHIMLFINRLNEAKKLPVSSYNERAVTQLSSELRAIMRDILEFQGKIKTGVLVQLNIMQLQMTKLTSFLLSELCEDDRQKLMKALPQIIKEASEEAHEPT
jgi:hypothetical protein